MAHQKNARSLVHHICTGVGHQIQNADQGDDLSTNHKPSLRVAYTKYQMYAPGPYVRLKSLPFRTVLKN